MNTNTEFLIMAEYGTHEIPLEDVAMKYFGIKRQQAFRKAARQEFPFPVYRVGDQKAVWSVKARDLARYLDDCYAEGVTEWKKRQTG